MERRNLSRMKPEQLVVEIRRACEVLEDAAHYMGEASMILHTQTRRPDFREAAGRTASIPDNTPREAAERIRRETVADVSSVYTLYANTWQRFSGMILQGIRRTIPSQRIMKRLEEKQGFTHGSSLEITEEPRRRKATPEAQTSMNDLVELYGIETVNYAQR